MSKQTAVEWLYFQLIQRINPHGDTGELWETLQKAKEMEKKQMIDMGTHCFIESYNKSQETHPFSEEDVRFMLSEAFKASQEGYQITADEIIQIWKEQPKVIYYNTIKQ